ncbi:MAG: peptide deformylase [Halobacteriovorax sp.]|nr:peptide deformylase [Halobacteriovorax sp.]|tara:strand:- start:66349 stop:66891 length:543 start_codon:yes stop_codon:yes gene_type:complete
MAVKKVIRMGHPVLRQTAAPLTDEEIGSPETKELVQDLLDTMAAEDGIGIAAPQIGISKQVALVGVPEDSERYPDAEETPLYVVINPKIKFLDETPQGFWEGCLSVPGLRGYVERPRKIQVDFKNLEGEEQTLVLEDFDATVFQHELDHLFGVLYVDRIKDSKQLMYTEEFVEFYAKEEE